MFFNIRAKYYNDYTFHKFKTPDELFYNSNSKYNEIEIILIHGDVGVLGKLPSKLRHLDCDSCRLTSLPELPETLILLYCCYNDLEKIQKLPPNLNVLLCNYNKITELPELPPKLRILACYYNHLTKLPNLPNSLHRLKICNNKIIKLPDKLPPKLQILWITDNKISTLPELPDTIIEFHGSKNNIKYPPIYLPNEMEEFYCEDNLLEYLPVNLLNCRLSRVAFNPISNYITNVLGYVYLYFDIRKSYLRNTCNKIGAWYLECKYNPKYEQCKKRLKLEFEELYEDSTE